MRKRPNSYLRDRRDLHWRGKRSLGDNIQRKYGRALVMAGLLVLFGLVAQLAAWLDSGGLRRAVLPSGYSQKQPPR